MAYAQSLDRSRLAHPTLSLSGSQNRSGVELVTRVLSIPAVKRTGFFGDSDKLQRSQSLISAIDWVIAGAKY